MEHGDKQSDAREIEVFYPETVDVIDPRHPHSSHAYSREAPPFRSRKRLAIILFVATCLSTFYVGATMTNPEINPTIYDYLRNGLSYAGPLMLILTFHEMGHYLQARRYHVPATFPFFIPMPISPFGTMGAVIVQGAGVANRKQMFDIAISGPLAGLVLALPFAWFGLKASALLPADFQAQGSFFGDPLILQWMSKAIFPEYTPTRIVNVSPMAFAGWVGIFITALNLVPIGQLDGGHILYMLIGRRAHRVAIGVLWLSIAFMVFTRNFSYLFLVLLLMTFGTRHPPTSDDTVPLGRTRIILGWLTLAFIFIGFTPTPIMEIPEPTPAAPPPPPRKEQINTDDFVHIGGPKLPRLRLQSTNVASGSECEFRPCASNC